MQRPRRSGCCERTDCGASALTRSYANSNGFCAVTGRSHLPRKTRAARLSSGAAAERLLRGAVIAFAVAAPRADERTCSYRGKPQLTLFSTCADS
jgi:hypothetical protein